MQVQTSLPDSRGLGVGAKQFHTGLPGASQGVHATDSDGDSLLVDSCMQTYKGI